MKKYETRLLPKDEALLHPKHALVLQYGQDHGETRWQGHVRGQGHSLCMVELGGVMPKRIIQTGTPDDFFKRAHEHAAKLDRDEKLAPECRVTFEDPDELVAALITTESYREALRDAIKQFAAAHPEYSTPEGAKDKCREASGLFCDYLVAAGITDCVVDEFAVINLVAHKAVRVHGNMWIDWTARQFDPNTTWPKIVVD